MSNRSAGEINEARARMLEEHLRAENAHDVGRIMNTFSQSAKFTLNGNTYGGHNLIRIAHERFGFSEGGSFSDLRIAEQRRYASDSAIILEQTVSGKHTGTWVLRFYAIAFTLILAAGFTEHTGWPFAFAMLAAGAHLLWQVKKLDINSADNCLLVFRSNRETGALIGLALLLASWFG